MKYYIICFKCNKMLARNASHDEKEIALSDHSKLQCGGDYLGSLEIIGIPENAEELARYMTGDCPFCGKLLIGDERHDCQMIPNPIQYPGDPWKHRSAKMKCNTCMWFVEKKVLLETDRAENEAISIALKNNSLTPDTLREYENNNNFNIINHKYNQPQIGRCRRNAPTIDGYPVVFENDWCGSHKLDENKT